MEFRIIFPLVAAISSFSISLVPVFKRGTDAISRSFAALTLTIALWSIAITLLYILPEGRFLVYTAKSVYFIGSLIAFIFFYFSLSFLNNKFPSRQLTWGLVGLQVLLFILYYFTDLIIEGYQINDVIGFTYGQLRFLFEIPFFLFFGFGFFIFFKMRRNASAVLKKQLNFIILGSTTGLFMAGVTNIIMPWFSNFSLVWLGPFLVIGWPFSIAYAILKHHLFNIKVALTEFLVFVLWIFVLIQALFSTGFREGILNGLLFLAVIIVGFFLIRGVIKEAEAKSKIESLVLDLGRANSRLKELDKLKSEFVSIASHQLRSPLTAIRGYASMLLEGTFGKVPSKMLPPIKQISESTLQLVNLVENFLNITRIEQHRIKYSFKKVSLKNVIETALKDLEPNIKQSGARIFFHAGKDPYTVRADSDKIKQVVLNLVDNAVKYTPKGRVDITLKKTKSGKVLLTVADNGIGFSEEFHHEMFDKFTRGDNAQDLHSNGSGIGLYLAKEIVVAHKGRIWARSGGVGKGTTVFVELPTR